MIYLRNNDIISILRNNVVVSIYHYKMYFSQFSVPIYNDRDETTHIFLSNQFPISYISLTLAATIKNTLCVWMKNIL